MSMLECPTTTTDAEVTHGRQLHNLITTLSPKYKDSEQSTFILQHFYRRLKLCKSLKSKTEMKTSSNRDDRPLGGDCWERTFIFIQVSVITSCNKMITTTSTKNKER